MSTKRDALRVVTATLFAVLCLIAIYGGIMMIFKIFSGSGSFHTVYIAFIQALVYFLVALYLITRSEKKEAAGQTGKRNGMKGLYIIPAGFFLIVMVRRVLFYYDNLKEFFSLHRPLSSYTYDIFKTDYQNLLWESAILLLMFFLINPLVFETKQEKKNNTGKCAFVAAALFAMPAVWLVYQSIFIAMDAISRNAFRGTWFYWVLCALLLCGYMVTALSLFKGKRELLTAGAGISFLYIIFGSFSAVFSRHIIYLGSTHFSYLFGYACIAVFSVATLVLEKNGKELRSKLWLILPVLFLISSFALSFQEMIKPEAEDYIMKIVSNFAIFFAMLWAIYPKGLPKWREKKGADTPVYHV